MSEDRWQFTTGPYGSRVRVEESHVGSPLHIHFTHPETGQRKELSLGFPVRDSNGEVHDKARAKAKKKATALSDRLLEGRVLEEFERTTTLGKALDYFRRNELQGISESHESEQRRQLTILENFFGRGFDLDSLKRRDWKRLWRDRKSGRIDAKGRVVPDPEDRRELAPRTVAQTLKALRQVCRAVMAEGMLSRDPTQGWDLPKQPDPHRPEISESELSKMLQAAPEVHPFMKPLLVIAAETGRRRGELVQLRWSDWFPNRYEYGALRWRGEVTKNGRTTIVPVSPAVREALKQHRQQHPGVGEAYLFPAPRDQGHVRPRLLNSWWRKTEQQAGVEHVDGRAWHSLRRRFANRRKHLPVQDVAAVGGWKTPRVLEEVYQHADAETSKRAVYEGSGLPEAGEAK